MQELGLIVRDIVQVFQLRRLTYFGHVVRMDNIIRLARIALHGRTSAHRRPERARKKWIDNIVEDCQQMNISVHEAERETYDRHKIVVYGAQPGLSASLA